MKEVVGVGENFEIHLIDGPSPEASIDLELLAPLAQSLHELNLRIARWQVDRVGAGRTPEAVRALASTRLIAVKHGSTTLDIIRGVPALLDLDDEIESQIDEAFWRVLASIAASKPDSEVPGTVRASVLDLIDALKAAAHAVLFQSMTTAERRVEFGPSSVSREAWSTLTTAAAEVETVIVGVLDAADLQIDRFRVHDDAGNTVHVTHVADSLAATRLLGQRVLIVGVLRQQRGRFTIDRPHSLALEPALSVGVGRETADELTKAGPSQIDEDLFTDDEFQAFLIAARGI